MSLNGNLTVPDNGFIYSNTSNGTINIGKEQQVININGIPNFSNTLESLSVNNLKAIRIEGINDTINIGPQCNIPNIINIGNDNSVVNIKGTSTYTFTNIVEQTVQSAILILNTDISNNMYGLDAGIQINSISGPGYIKTTCHTDNTKFLIKAPNATSASYIATTDLNNNMTVLGTLHVGGITDVETTIKNKANIGDCYTKAQINNMHLLNTITGMSIFATITNQSNITSLNVLNTSNLLGNVTAYSRLNVLGKTTINESLAVTGPIIGNSIVSLSSFSVIGKSIFNGAVTMNSSLNVDGLVTNSLKFTGPVTMPSTLLVQDDITGMNDMNINGDLNVQGNIVGNIIGPINVNNISTNNITVFSNLYVGNNTIINKDLFVSGNTNIKQHLYVNNTTTMNSDLSVIGNTNINNIYIKGDAIMNRTLYVDDNVTMNSKLYVDSDVTINSTLYVDGDVTMNSNMYVDGIINTHNIQVDDLIKTDDILVNNNTTIMSNLSVGGINNIEAAINNKLGPAALNPYLTKTEARTNYMPLSATSALNINGYDLTKMNFNILLQDTTLRYDMWINGVIGLAQTNEFTITLPSAFDIINMGFNNNEPFGFCFHTYLNYQLGTGRYNININTNNNVTSVTTIYDGYGFTNPITDRCIIPIDIAYAPVYKTYNTHFITRIDNSTSMTVFKL